MTAKRSIGVKAEWLGEKQFRAVGPSGYSVMMDSSAKIGEGSTGNSPMELLVVALCGCMGMGVTNILKKMRQELESLQIEADALRSDDTPGAITEVHLTFHATGAVVPSRIWQAIRLESEQYCPVAASLKAVIVPHVVLNGENVPMPEQPASAIDPE
ncbi:OsmC family protein [Brevibacillus sp. TJ4]|uniref:OsmC family protein n=1 Tax=Brevibacillus sp. TJ4 TaxID=3234853 RepID=UPI0037D1A7D1